MRSSSHYFLEGLNDLGFDYIFSNFGTDHVSIIEEMARWRAEGRKYPEVLLVPHENVAMHMAQGYAAVTGKGQLVMVHVDSGTANSAMGMHNMFRSRVPVMLMAGKAPYTVRGELPGSRDNYVHFVQDPFDIASLVRPYVKWDYNLHTGVNAKEVLRRAHTVMQSDPPGPVYLTLPREVLAEEWEESQVASFDADRYGAVPAGGVAPAQATEIARRLMAAERPIVVTSYLGRKAEAVAALEALALLCGIRVYEFAPIAMNISRESPCFGGFDPGKNLQGADLGLLLDVDVPWLPKYADADPATHWIHVDVDTLKKDFPMWGFATDMRVQADVATVLRQVIDIVNEQADDGFRQRVADRIAGWDAANQARRAEITRQAQARGKPGAISPAYLMSVIGQAIAPHDIIVNEAVRNIPAVLSQIPRTQPLTLLGCAGGGLGYSGGMAIGAKLAKPEVRVLQIVGDGGFHFGCATSVYAVTQRYGAPIFTVVLDNNGWQAVKEAVTRVYPDGAAFETNEFQAKLTGEIRAFEKIGEAFGAHGEQVTDPAELQAAVARCLQAVDSGRSAVLNVRIGSI